MAASNTDAAEKRAKIAAGYDAMAGQYLSWVQTKPSRRLEYLDRMLSSVSHDSKLLEVGCGAGIPVLEKLVAHVNGTKDRVTGVDISQEQNNLAQQHCPQAHLIRADMLELAFDDATFDGVASFFAIFHLHRDQQREFIQRLYKWTKPGGFFVGNMGASDSVEVKENFFGAEMYWSSFEAEETKSMFRDAGFVLEEASVLEEEGLKSQEVDHGVKFLWILAHRPAGTS